MIIHCLNIFLFFRSRISSSEVVIPKVFSNAGSGSKTEKITPPKPWWVLPVSPLEQAMDKIFPNVHLGAYRNTATDNPRLETAVHVVLKADTHSTYEYRGPFLKFPTKPDSLKNDFLYPEHRTLPMWVIPGMSGGPIFKLKPNEKTRAYVQGVVSYINPESDGVYGFCPILQYSGDLIQKFMGLSHDGNAAKIRQQIQIKGGYYADHNGHNPIDPDNPVNQAPGEGYWFLTECPQCN